MTNLPNRDFPWDVRGAFEKILGKRIKGVVVKESYNAPDAQIFILFTDNTYFEIYGGEMHGTKDVNKGGLEEVKLYLAGKGRGITFERMDESIKDTNRPSSEFHQAGERDLTQEEGLLRKIYDDLFDITESLAQQLPASAKTELYGVTALVKKADESSLDTKSEILASLDKINERLVHSNMTDAAVLLSKLRFRVKDFIVGSKEEKKHYSSQNEAKTTEEVESRNSQKEVPALWALANKNDKQDGRDQPINKSTGRDMRIALAILAGLIIFWALPFVILKKKIDFVWPGLFIGLPGFLMAIVMPSVLLFALYRYTSVSKLRKIAYTPLCIIGPLFISGMFPLLISISGFIEVTDSDAFERYATVATLFGDYSNYVWTLLASFVVYGIYIRLKKTTVP